MWRRVCRSSLCVPVAVGVKWEPGGRSCTGGRGWASVGRSVYRGRGLRRPIGFRSFYRGHWRGTLRSVRRCTIGWQSSQSRFAPPNPRGSSRGRRPRSAIAQRSRSCGQDGARREREYVGELCARGVGGVSVCSAGCAGRCAVTGAGRECGRVRGMQRTAIDIDKARSRQPSSSVERSKEDAG